MILEGFEIENWSCIRRVVVDGLPPTGVIVLHGPNGTGKSSILEALRACMMDNKSTSKALGRGFPKNSSEKPRVSVTFRSGGISWRITKQFNSKESKLESRTVTGDWKLETADPSEAHERTRQLAGGSDSNLGLHQLLWLTQAEFRLPDPKKFDADVQSRLRSVLGVLQTPQDDRFLGHVKKEWSRWFGMRSKPGEKPKLKKDCPLDKALADLGKRQAELAAIEEDYRAFENMLERSGNLEVQSRDLRRQQAEKTAALGLLQKEYERSIKRLEAHRLAGDRVAVHEKELNEHRATQQRRAEIERRIRDAHESAESAGSDVEAAGRALQNAEQRLRQLRLEIQTLRNTGRELQARLNEVGERRHLLTLQDSVKTAREDLRRAEHTLSELEELKKQARERPAPDAAHVKKLEDNRTTAGQLRAEPEAALITLSLVPEPGAAAPRLAIDETPALVVGAPADGSPIRRSVRRRAEITIAGWGRVELTRGSDAPALDQIEADLGALDRGFAEGLAPFGVAAADPTALDQLRGLAADKKVRDPELKRKHEEIARLAPNGLDALREELAQLEKRHQAAESELAARTLSALRLADAAELESLAGQSKKDIAENEKSVATLQSEVERIERDIDGDSPAEPTTGSKSARANSNKTAAPGFRQQEAVAKDRLATLEATAKARREELDRLPTAEQIEGSLREANLAISKARAELEAAKLSETEETIRERLGAAKDGSRALEEQLSAADKAFHEIKGAMSQSEGLHQKRAAAASRVEELTRQTERETLEADAYDRLYALFEECREKQLGSVMGPIHDRILRWMQLLRIGDYHSIHFNDQFLPDKLVAGGGATEVMLDEESVGTIEQVALMVRLALGSTLSTPEEPVVAMLDDPLTHGDVVRLDRMRAPF